MRRSSSVPVLLFLLAAVISGCDRPNADDEFFSTSVRYDTGTVRIETESDTLLLGVEIAESDAQRQNGLMHRPSLAADSGMIFLFQQEQPADNYFWMYDTLIPLSIAYLDRDGRIASIRDMEPCPSEHPQYCPNYEARVPYWSALEVNRGYFEDRGVGIGDRVVLVRD